MSLINIRCTNDHIEEVNRPIADWPATPPCPTCNASTEQIHLPPAVKSSIDPVVIFQAADGTFRFPGDPSGRSAHQYARQGMTKIELRSAADVRRFESHMNKRELSLSHRKVEAHQAQREARESHMRAQLRQSMSAMTEYGRDLARAAMRRADHAPRERARDAGFHVEALSYDRSNRPESRDPSGRRRRD
jgi:hypothetical protein